MVAFYFQAAWLSLLFDRCAEKSMMSSATRGFRVSKRFDSGCFQVGQALDVLAMRHHRHPKVGSRLPDRTNQFAAHLSDRRKYMFDPSPHLGDSVITPLLTFGELALGGTGARQGSCPMSHAAIACLSWLDDSDLMSSGFSGLRVTAPMGVQFRVLRVQRLGLAACAARYK